MQKLKKVDKNLAESFYEKQKYKKRPLKMYNVVLNYDKTIMTV